MSLPVGGEPRAGAVRTGSHVCALYSGPAERDRVLVPFVREGLRRGDECVCLVDGLDPLSARRQTDELAGAVRLGGRLTVQPASDVCSRGGELSADQVTDLVTTTLACSGADGLPAVNVAVEMSWSQPGTRHLHRYESAVREILAGPPAVVLCLHDLQRIGTGMLTEVLRAHSTVLLDGTALHQHPCPAPSDRPRPAPGTRARYPLARLPGAAVKGGGTWLSLTGAEVRVAELVASGMTNRAMAEVLAVSPHTVDAHLKHMYVKLDIHSRVELTVLALRFGSPTA